LVADNPEWSIAMIYNNSSRDVEAYSIRPGSNLVVDDAELVEVRSREIIVRRASHYERCLADAEAPKGGHRASSKTSKSTKKLKDDDGDRSKGVTKVSETDYNIDGSEIDRVLNNLSEVATKARIVPSFKNGKPNGFKLFSIKPGSIYSKIGLRNGDVIQSVNGHEMNSPDKALEIYQKLKDSSGITVDIQRRGRAMTMNYAIGR
jgi:general secretion pathway protein C